MAAVQPNYPSPPQDMARHSSTPPPLANSMEQQNYAPIPQANPVARQSSTPPPQANPMPQQSYLIEQQNYAPLPQVNQMPQQIYVPLPQAKPMPQQNYSPLPQVSPMAQQSYAPLPQANPMAIVGPQFCASNTIDLAIVRKVWTVSHGNFEVTDVNGNPMFKVRGRALTRHAKRVLLNSAGYPIITLRQKILSAHSRWQVFRGDSSDTKDLIFSVKTSSRFQFKTHLDVFLANNITEEVCDFKVKGNWSQRSCVIYAGESSNIIAQMHKKYTVRSVLLGKYEFMVTVYPHVDHAFIVALIVILDEINSDD